MNKKYALIGGDVSYSYSHIIHASIMELYGISGSYTKISVNKNNFERVTDIIRGLDGANVTNPYKRDIIKVLDKLEGSAAQFLSCNTIDFADGKLVGHSTDGVGFVSALRYNNINFKGYNILIVGAGGVARSLAYELSKYDCTVYVRNRTNYNALELVKTINSDKVKLIDYEMSGKYDMIVNCTSVGANPLVDFTPLSKDELRGAKILADCIYSPTDTLLISLAKDLGIQTIGGFDMLFFQAYEAQKIWQKTQLDFSKAEQLLGYLKTKLI